MDLPSRWHVVVMVSANATLETVSAVAIKNAFRIVDSTIIERFAQLQSRELGDRPGELFPDDQGRFQNQVFTDAHWERPFHF
jgi:hypothetical protein